MAVTRRHSAWSRESGVGLVRLGQVRVQAAGTKNPRCYRLVFRGKRWQARTKKNEK